MLLTFVIGLLASFDSSQSVNVTGEDILVPARGQVSLDAEYVDFQVCILRNKFNKIVCKVETGPDFSLCGENIDRDILFGANNRCQFTLNDVQDYDHGTWSVELYDGFGVLLLKQTYNLFQADPKYGCFERGIGYVGTYNMPNDFAQQAEDCQRQCEIEFCWAWTFDQKSQNCFKHSEGTFSDRKVVPWVVSGQKYCPGCFRLGMATRQSPWKNFRLRNDADCLKVCNDDSKCKFFQWNHSDKQCSLFQSEVENVVVDRDAMLGIPMCEDIEDIAKLWKNNPDSDASATGVTRSAITTDTSQPSIVAITTTRTTQRNTFATTTIISKPTTIVTTTTTLSTTSATSTTTRSTTIVAATTKVATTTITNLVTKPTLTATSTTTAMVTFQPPSAKSDKEISNSTSNQTGILVGAALGALAFVSLAVSTLYIMCKRRRAEQLQPRNLSLQGKNLTPTVVQSQEPTPVVNPQAMPLMPTNQTNQSSPVDKPGFGLKESHHAVTITYSEDGIYDEVTCDCKDCSEGLGQQDHILQHYNRDSVYLYELYDL